MVASDTTGRMGRPALKVRPTQVRLPLDFAPRIKAVVGKKYRLAEFIRMATEKELRRLEKKAGIVVESELKKREKKGVRK